MRVTVPHDRATMPASRVHPCQGCHQRPQALPRQSDVVNGGFIPKPCILFFPWSAADSAQRLGPLQ